jgi:hypothetical protein
LVQRRRWKLHRRRLLSTSQSGHRPVRHQARRETVIVAVEHLSIALIAVSGDDPKLEVVSEPLNHPGQLGEADRTRCGFATAAESCPGQFEEGPSDQMRACHGCRKLPWATRRGRSDQMRACPRPQKVALGNSARPIGPDAGLPRPQKVALGNSARPIGPDAGLPRPQKVALGNFEEGPSDRMGGSARRSTSLDQPFVGPLLPRATLKRNSHEHFALAPRPGLPFGTDRSRVQIGGCKPRLRRLSTAR